MRRSWLVPARPSSQTRALLVLACVLGFTVPALPADSVSFIRFDVSGGTETMVHGINGAGQMVGTFRDGVCGHRGYVRAATGTLTPIDVRPFPSKCETPRQTVTTDAYSINDAGQIVGTFSNGWEQRSHGYARSATGAFTVIDVPGAAQTEANGINRAGWIVGGFEDAGRKWHGYLRSATGAFTFIDVPGARYTYARGINDAGQIVGFFFDADKSHGFLRTADGRLTIIDVPGATATDARGINRAGQIVGTFTVGTFTKNHGFVRSATGAFTSIDVPGATWTEANGINNAGQIVGTFTDAAIGYPNPWPPPWHGFVTRR